jgi:hypothetical protein
MAGSLSRIQTACSARAPHQDGASEVPDMTDVQDHSAGDWHVRAGSEDAFIGRGREFLE